MKLTISNGVFESELLGIKEFSIENSEMLLFFKTYKAFLRACDGVLSIYESMIELIPDVDIPTLSVDEIDLIIYLSLSEFRVMYSS